MKQRHKICIIGGGPAGLIAAQKLSLKPSFDVHLFEQKPSVGRKFLIAGRGGLNLTHSEEMEIFLDRYGPATDFLRPYIEAFSPQDLIAWATDLGIDTFTGSSGRIFPEGMKATPLMRAWTKRLTKQGVSVHLKHGFIDITDGNIIEFKKPDGSLISVESDAILFAAGGGSYPHLGATGLWRKSLARAGVSIAPFKAINCGYNIGWSEYLTQKFAGTPLKNIDISIDDSTAHGDVVLTGYGLEGGAIYGLGRAINTALDINGTADITLDLRPSILREQLAEKLAAPRKKQSLSTYLRKQVKLSPLEIALIHEKGDKEALNDPARLAQIVKTIPLTITSARPLERAISTMGGIELFELDSNLMLRARAGCFAAGEMIDWDAPTGGYLLQACFSTGVAAAKGIENWLTREKKA